MTWKEDAHVNLKFVGGSFKAGEFLNSLAILFINSKKTELIWMIVHVDSLYLIWIMVNLQPDQK